MQIILKDSRILRGKIDTPRIQLKTAHVLGWVKLVLWFGWLGLW
jgi:hypothetical protein